MSAGLAVVWQVSFLNKFCWIWSSGVVINTLKFSWMKQTCDVSKVFSQIESLQVDIKSLKYRKESFWSIIRYWYKSPKIMPIQHGKFVGTRHSLVVIRLVEHLADPQFDSRGEPVAFCRVQVSTHFSGYRFFRQCKYYVLTKKSRNLSNRS